MPEALERALRKEAAKRGFGKERTNAYVYGSPAMKKYLKKKRKKK